MSEEITDAQDCVIKIGGRQAGGTRGQLIITEFEHSVSQDKERKYGIGNVDAQGRTHGNREIDLSFTHLGEDGELFDQIQEGNFDVALTGNNYRWRLVDVDDTDFTVTVSDGGDYELDFEGNALSYEGNRI